MDNYCEPVVDTSLEGHEESALNDLLHPVTLSEFADFNWNKEPLLVTRNNPSFFEGLFSFKELDHVLAYSQVEYPEIRIVHRDHGEAKDLMPLLDSYDRRAGDRVNGIYRSYGQGCTIIIGNLHRFSPTVANLRHRLETVIDHEVTIGSYATPSGAQGFLPHFDLTDAFIVQLQGSKLWSVWPPRFELPFDYSKQPTVFTGDLGQPQIEINLQPGDTLYIPRGWIHEAKTAAEPSLHLTVRIHVMTWKALLEELLQDIARSDLNLRQALPPRWICSLDAACLEQEFTDLLNRAGNIENIEELRDRIRRKHLRQGQVITSGRLSQVNSCHELTSDTLLQIRSDTSFAITQSKGLCTLDFNGGRLSCDAAMLSVLTFICEKQRPFTPRQIPTKASEVDILFLLRRLINIGFLHQPAVEP